MHLTITQAELLQALQHVSRAVEASSPLPILAGIWLDARPDRFILAGCNTRTRIQVELPAASGESGSSTTIHQAGSIVVPARYFVDMIRKLPPGNIELYADSQKRLAIHAADTEYRLCGTDADEFPAIPASTPFEGRLSLPNPTLRSLLKQVAFAASSSENRPVLTGVLWRVEGQTLQLLATDGVRLAQTAVPISPDVFNGSPIQIIVPGATLTDLYRMLDNDAEAATEIAISRSQIHFRSPAFLLSSVLLDGMFPSVDRLIPRVSTTDLTLNVELLLQALERVCLLAGDEHLVQLQTKAAAVILNSVNSPIGDVKADIPLLGMVGDPASIYFNGRYMIQILKALEGAEATIRLSGSMSPIVIEPAGQHSALYLLTPIRHKDRVPA